jgi:hypothetical protein
MSVLEEVCGRASCLQCWADQMLAMSPFELEEQIERNTLATPAIAAKLIPPPDTEEMMMIKRSGRREVRLIAHLALLESHECGKAQQHDCPVAAYRRARSALRGDGAVT